MRASALALAILSVIACNGSSPKQAPTSKPAPSTDAPAKPDSELDERNTLIAMIALRSDDPTVAYAPFRDHVRAHWPDMEVPDQATNADGMLAFDLDGGVLALGGMPAPIPWSDLEWSAAAAAWHFENSQAEMKKHRSHILVSAIRTRGTALERHVMLTHAVMSVLATRNDAIGVYWNGRAVSSAEFFQRMGAEMNADTLPIPLWITIAPIKLDDGSPIALTHGLDVFGHQELAMRGMPTTTVPDLFDIAHYILSAGATLKHGETLGDDAQDRRAITAGPSPNEGDPPVLWIEPRPG